MSLINQVLKDLEKRHAGAGEVRGMSRAVRPLPEDGPQRGLWIVLGLIVAGAVAGGTWWFMVQPQAAASRSNAGGSITAAPAPAKAPEVAPASPPNTVPSAASTAALAAPSPAPALDASVRTPAPAPTALRPMPETARLPQSEAALAPAPTPKPQPAPVTRATAAPVPATVTAAATASTTGAEVPAMATPPAVPKPGVNPARKSKPKPAAEAPANPGPTSKQAAEYPEPDGLEGPASIDKQMRPPSQRERAEAEFRLGMVALHAGNPAEAEDKLNAALTIDPLADNARQALLGLYIERGRREDAERVLEDRLRVDRKHAGFAMALGRLQLERGANGDALVTLQRSLAYGENSSDYQAMTANALGRVGRHKESTERFEAATKLAPRNPVWHMGLGVELRADNRPAEARAAFQRARELGGLNPQLASFVDQQLHELK